jgi:hypothetical protein
MQVFGMTHEVTADSFNDLSGVICRQGLNRGRIDT